MRRKVFIAAFALFCATSLVAGVTVTSPDPDAIVMSASATIQGVAIDEGVTHVVVSRGVNRMTATVDPSTNTWAVTDFPLILGLNKIVIQAEPASAGVVPEIFFLTRGQEVEKRPRQRVLFVWDDDTNGELEAIVLGTLNGPLTDTELTAFIAAVRAEVPNVFKRAYRSVADIELVSADGDDVHTVRFSGIDSGFFGLSPGDCGNRELKQESGVFVGTYRVQIVGSFGDWAPMKKEDSITDRVQDIAEALGRTAAHEVGHSLGLVADGGPCRWMEGCDGFHTCFALQQIHNGLSRFGGGFFIMDPGPRSANNARIAEVTRGRRSTPRRPATFATFDQRYLAFIHPLTMP